MHTYLMYRLAFWLSRVLPRQLTYWIGLRLADLFYRFGRTSRAHVKRNLSVIFAHQHIELSDATLTGFTRKTFQYFGKYLIDFFRCTEMSGEAVRKLVGVAHKERLDACIAHGRGVILATAHIGNWELGGALVCAMGYPFKAVVRPMSEARVDRLFQEQRSRRGIGLISIANSPLGIVRALKRGEVVALLGDRDFTGSGEPADFFGKKVRLPVGPAWLAHRTGAPILPATALRQVDDSILVRFFDPIWPDQHPDMNAIQQKLIESMEHAIAEAPYQWFIFDDFWRVTEAPQGETARS